MVTVQKDPVYRAASHLWMKVARSEDRTRSKLIRLRKTESLKMDPKLSVLVAWHCLPPQDCLNANMALGQGKPLWMIS